MADPAANIDPFTRVYAGVRGELARAELPSGGQIRVDETARRFKVSPTPVREALARLSGERLVRGCRRQGYFVPKPSVSDLIELYTLSEMHLVTAIRLQSRQSPPRVVRRAEQGEPFATDMGIGQIFLAILAKAEVVLLLDSGALILERLSLARRAEDAALGQNACSEIYPLLESRRFSALARAIRSYHSARRENAVAIAQAIGPAAPHAGEYFRDMV